MATSDPDFYEARKFSPEPYDEPRRERGCFFYGCIIASVMSVLVMIALGAGVYILYRAARQVVQDYTATEPRELPKAEMPAERRQTLKERVEAFRKAIEEGSPTEPLVLDSDDLNALIAESPAWRDKIYVTIEGDKVKGQVSIPLESFGLSMFKGRYLNGEAELKASLSDGVPIVTLESFEVNGKRPPEELLVNMRKENLAKDAYKDPKEAEQIRKLESIEIKDGKIIITPRGSGSSGAAGRTTADRQDLPVDVLAPPDAGKPRTEPTKAEPTKAEAKPSPAEEPAKKP